MTTVDPIEVIWVLLSLIGLIAALLVLWFAVEDLDGIYAAKLAEQLRREQVLVGRAMRRMLAVIVWLQSFFLTVGVRSLLLPPNPYSSELGSILVGLMFVSSAGLLTWSSILMLIDRIRFDRLPTPEIQPEAPSHE